MICHLRVNVFLGFRLLPSDEDCRGTQRLDLLAKLSKLIKIYITDLFNMKYMKSVRQMNLFYQLSGIFTAATIKNIIAYKALSTS